MTPECSVISGSASPPATLEEQLARHFYSWEYRGRGWVVYDAPVDLEPPFRPFVWVLPRRTVIDDGRHPTFLSRLVEMISTGRARESKPAQASDPLAELLDEPEPEFITEPPSRGTIQIRIPNDLKVSSELSTRFMQTLRYLEHPVSFEILASEEQVSVQMNTSSEDYPQLYSQLSAHFPDCTLSIDLDPLRMLWQPLSGEEPVIVDFGLSQEFMLPLRTFGAFDPDPLIALVGALAMLGEEETAVFQVLFRPVRNPWAESILRSVTDADGKSVFSTFPEMLRLAREKASSPLHAVVVRVAARSPSRERAWEIVRSMGGALSQYTHPGVTELIPLSNDGYPTDQHEEDLLLRQSRRSGMILNIEELSSLAHLPSVTVRSRQFRREERKTKAAPELTAGHSLLLGENLHHETRTPVTLSPEQRTRHLYAVGASGTGKSTFLLNLIRQDLMQGNGFAVLDPHGDTIEEIIGYIPPERVADVILLDPSDQEYSLGLNILSAHSLQEKDLLASDLVSVFRRLSTSWGDQMTSVLANAILAFLESSRGGTLIDLRRFLVDKDFRARFLPSVEDSEVVYYWLKEFPLLSGRPQAPILTRLDTFLRPKPIRYMVAQKESRLDFRWIMDEKKILLAKLSQGAIGEENAYLLGSLLVSKFHQAAMGRQEQEASTRIPFSLYIDECHHFVTPSMESILTGTRKYKLSLILAHQELRQLGSGDLASAVLTNPYTRVCFRLGDTDAKKLAEGFSFFEASDLQNLGTGEAIARVERAEYDFNLSVPPLPAVDREYAKQVREYVVAKTRERYSTPRATIEAELAKERVEIPIEPTTPKRSPEHPPVPPTNESGPPSATEPPTPEPTPAKPPTPAPVVKPQVPPSVPPSPGRGGKEHKYLQQMIKQKGEELGYRALVEKSIDGGCVDVSLESDRHRIACEISVTSTPEQEVGNVAKCLTAGYERVVLVVSDPKRIGPLSERLSGMLTGDDRARACVQSLPEFFLSLEELGAQAAGRETRVRGIAVKTRFHALTEEEKTSKNQALSEIVGKVIRKSTRRKP
ncbi:ATP-binding protein [bacterium]|nr:ATP-binding protein [bacterium]